MRSLIALFALSCCVTSHATPLPSAVTQELKRAHIPQSAIAVEVRELGSRTPLISLNAQRAMNPASVMKLLTTYAALDLLGPAYTWKTEAWLDGEMKDGVLEGNLILKGYGDPKFTIEQFWLWLTELRARGLREIRGDLLFDRNYYDLPEHDPSQFDDDPMRAYNVGPDALLVNFNVLRLRYLPDGNALKVVTEPPLESVTLDNQLNPLGIKVDCDNWDDLFSVQPNGDSVVLMGDYPVECGEREQNLSVMPHSRYVGALFRSLWKELGGTLQGKDRDGVAGPAARLFSTHHSEPLSAVIRDINKFSNNVMARQVFLTLGESIPSPFDSLPAVTPAHGATFPTLAERTGRMSLDRSEVALQTWLEGRGLHFRELVLENGAGLSRKERISADHLADLLQDASTHPLSSELQSSLPILGVDGSVRKRLRDSEAASHAHLKTGTLAGVKTLAGYVRSMSGKEWIIVFLVNHPAAQRSTAAQDALIEWLAQK
jgi:D-alanyl-D-alanine carboxypeptidase/D-alanyl-D-alanine-endopeptidase (penicillin-binding protein 4)